MKPRPGEPVLLIDTSDWFVYDPVQAMYKPRYMVYFSALIVYKILEEFVKIAFL